MRVGSVTWMNRVQNESVTSRCEESSEAWRCSGVFSQRQQDGWIEIMAPPVYSRYIVHCMMVSAIFRGCADKHHSNCVL